MPRANRRRRDEDPRDLERALLGGQRRESYDGIAVYVRTVLGRQEGRSYVCPGCPTPVRGDERHVVVWPAEGLGGIDDRRHWHATCWAHRARRRPLGPWR